MNSVDKILIWIFTWKLHNSAQVARVSQLSAEIERHDAQEENDMKRRTWATVVIAQDLDYSALRLTHRMGRQAVKHSNH